MGTTWMPMTRMEPKSWLLGNGEVVQEPALEMTGTGRKIRVAGTSASVYAAEIDGLLGRAVEEIAKAKQTHVWIENTGGIQRLIEGSLAYLPALAKARLHLIHDPTAPQGATHLWWRFKDPTTPYEVLLTVSMQNHRTSVQVNGQITKATLSMPGRGYWSDDATQVVWSVQDPSFSEVPSALYYLRQDLTGQWQEFIRDNRPNWPIDEILGTANQQHARAGVSALLKMVRLIEDLDEIEVPDLASPFTPGYRSLKLHDTNVNAELLSDLTEYLDGAPSIEQAAEFYQQMLETLRSVGIQVQGKEPNDFMAALLAGEKATLNMQIFNLAEEGNRVDQDHRLSVHLPTGAFIVECTHHQVDKNIVAEKWEEALTMASLTGESDALLAYSRQYATENNERRTKQILKERG